MALGSSDVRLIDMTGFAAVSRRGRGHAYGLKRVTDVQSELLYSTRPRIATLFRPTSPLR